MNEIVHEPGTVRQIHYMRGRQEDGKYPVTYWGSIEEQIAEATAANARATSRHDHKMMPLFTMTEDCGHPNPEDDERFRDVDDLVDEWMRRNLPAMSWRDGDLYWKNKRRGEAVVPLYAEWARAQGVWDASHSGNVCLDSPMGECCTVCTDGDGDFGYEVEPCRLAAVVRDKYDDFWAMVSPEGREIRARQEAERS